MLHPASPWKTTWKTLSDAYSFCQEERGPTEVFQEVLPTQGLTRLFVCSSLNIKQYLKVFRSGRPSGGELTAAPPFNCAASNLFIHRARLCICEIIIRILCSVCEFCSMRDLVKDIWAGPSCYSGSSLLFPESGRVDKEDLGIQRWTGSSLPFGGSLSPPSFLFLPLPPGTHYLSFIPPVVLGEMVGG